MTIVNNINKCDQSECTFGRVNEDSGHVRLENTYMMFFPVIIARSPRIVPGSAASGLVAPIILRLRKN